MAGKVGTVVLSFTRSSRQKLSAASRSTFSDNPSLADLLTQIRGSQVKVTSRQSICKGTVLGFWKKAKTVER